MLDQLNLVVRDMDATLSFYRSLGLQIPDDTVWRTGTGPHHVEVTLENGFELAFDSVELAKVYNAGWQEPGGTGGRNVLSFRLRSRESVDEVYAELSRAGHAGLQPPYDTFWGSRYAIIEDPDGNHVGLMSPTDPARRGAPPSL